MISYFQNGITDIHPSKDLDLPQLVRLIKTNPQKDLIEKIRTLRFSGDKSDYKILKKQLPYATPNCKLRVRSLNKNSDDIEKNLISFTQYLYVDIDVDGDVEQYKKYFIAKYGHLALLVCKSCSGGGISVLFRITNTITVDNFEDIWYKVRNTILIDEPVDEMCKNIGRAMFVSYDPDIYINYENEIEVNLSDNDTYKIGKEVNQYNSCGVFTNTLIYPFSRISFNDILKEVKFETQVEVENPIVDFKPIDYTKIFVPEVIVDGTKHKLYARIIHTLNFLNPEIDKDYILSYLFFINSNFAKPRMDSKELSRMFHSVYNGITNGDSRYVKTQIKNVHFNSTCGLSKNQKTKIANYINGAYRRSITIDKIQVAIQTIIQMGRKVTQEEVASISNLNVKTVRTHLKADRIDMEQIIQSINSDSYSFYDEPVEVDQPNINDLYLRNFEADTVSPLESLEPLKSTQNEGNDKIHYQFCYEELRRSG